MHTAALDQPVVPGPVDMVMQQTTGNSVYGTGHIIGCQFLPKAMPSPSVNNSDICNGIVWHHQCNLHFRFYFLFTEYFMLKNGFARD